MDFISSIAKASQLFVAAAKLASAGSPPASFDAFAQVLTSSRELARFIDDPDLTRLADEIHSAIELVGQHLGTEAADAKKVFLQAVPDVIPTPAEIVESGLDVKSLCDLMVQKMEQSNVAFDFRRTPMSHNYVRAVASASFEKILNDTTFIRGLEPAIYSENFAQHRKTQKLIAELLWRFEVTQNTGGQLSRAVIRMAQKIAEDVEDLPTAMSELGAAIATLRKDSNDNVGFGASVDATLATAATQSDQGEHEAALETIEAELNKIEQESFVAAVRLILAARKEAYLLRDPVLLGQWGTRLVRLFQTRLVNTGETMDAYRLVPYAESSASDLLAEGLTAHFFGRATAATSAAERAFFLLMAGRCLSVFAGGKDAPTHVLEKLVAGTGPIVADKAWTHKDLISEGSALTYVFRVSSRLALRLGQAAGVKNVSEAVMAYLQSNAPKLEKHEFAQVGVIMAELLTWLSHHHQDPVYLRTAIKSLQALVSSTKDTELRNSLEIAMGQLVVEELRMTGDSEISVSLAATLFDRRSKIRRWDHKTVLSWIDVLIDLRANDSAVREVVGDEDYLALLWQGQKFSQMVGVSDDKFFFRQLYLSLDLADRAETKAQFSEPVKILDALSELAWLADSPGHAAILNGSRGLVLVNLAKVAEDLDLARESVALLDSATRMFAAQGNTEARDVYAGEIERANEIVETIQSGGSGNDATTT